MGRRSLKRPAIKSAFGVGTGPGEGQGPGEPGWPSRPPQPLQGPEGCKRRMSPGTGGSGSATAPAGEPGRPCGRSKGSRKLGKFGGAELGEAGAALLRGPKAALRGTWGTAASVIHSACVWDVFYYYLKRFNLLFVPPCPASSPIVALRSGITRTNQGGGEPRPVPPDPISPNNFIQGL